MFLLLNLDLNDCKHCIFKNLQLDKIFRTSVSLIYNISLSALLRRLSTYIRTQNHLYCLHSFVFRNVFIKLHVKPYYSHIIKKKKKKDSPYICACGTTVLFLHEDAVKV